MLQKFQSLSMSKPAITRVFKVAIALVVAGAAGATGVAVWALVNGAVAIGGAQIVTVDGGLLAGAIVALSFASVLTGLGTVAAIVAWAAALLNTSRLEDKTWFATLLVLGLVSLGWVAM